jgi:hypothetical protein
VDLKGGLGPDVALILIKLLVDLKGGLGGSLLA